MTKADLPKDLVELLDELAIDTDLSREAIRQAIAAYPDHQDEILRYAINFHAMREEGDDEEVAPLPPVTLPSVPTTPVVDLFAGMTAIQLKSVARDCDIPLSVLSKLEDRAIRLETIPLLLLTKLATALGTKVEAVLGFLELAPTLSPSASYRSDQAPQVTDKIDFVTAIKNTKMDDAQRSRWLSLSE